MAIEFVNPLTAGTVLVREAIQSQNYDPGNAGWIIEADGDAEFNSVVIRGGTVVSGTALYYDGTPALGNLILSIAAQAGTDEYGNVYEAGLTSYSANGTINTFETATVWEHTSGTKIEIGVGGAQALQQFTPADAVGVTWADASLGTNITTDFGANTPSVFLQSPSDSVNTSKSSIRLLGGSPSSNNRKIQLVGDTEVLNGALTAPNMVWGTATTPAPGAGGGTTTVSVAFGKTLTGTPRVVAQCRSTVDPGVVTIDWFVDNITTTGFDIRAYRSTNSASSFDWFAVSN